MREPPPEIDLVELAHAAMLEHTTTLLAFFDAQFNFVCVNTAYACGSGHSVNGLIGRNHFDLFPNAENQGIFEQVRDTGEAVTYRAKPFEFMDQPERGITYWDWSLCPVRVPSGKIGGLVLSLLDVTEQVKANLTIRRSEGRYHNLFTGVREGFALHEIICDQNGKPVDYRFLDANPAFEELTGLDRSQIIGRTVREIMPHTED